MPKFNIYKSDTFLYYIDMETEFSEDFMYDIPEEIVAEYAEIESRRKELNKKLMLIKKTKDGDL